MKKPWKAKKKLLEGMEMRLDGAIDKIENMGRDVEINRMLRLYDNLMDKAHSEQEAALVAEEGEYQYGAEKFENADVKDITNKQEEISAKVSEKKERATDRRLE